MACNCSKNNVKKTAAKQVAKTTPVSNIDVKKPVAIKGVVKRPAR